MLLALSLSVRAQQTNQVQYKLPDGKIVSEHQLDSVNKAWGSRGFLMNHNTAHPEIVVISPMTDEYLKERAEQDATLKLLLNKPAPDFTLTDVKGKQWKLSALKGKTVVLNFWFTTCTGCVQEMPELNKLEKSYTNNNVVFLAPGLDDAKAINHFLKNHPFNYTLLPKAKTVSELYHVNTYPTSMVIDPEGIIRFQQVGGKNIEDALSAAINKFNH
ncbi:hypothetical protein GCM10027037_23760 [Mucilaginibacter koreensis]